MKNHALLFFLLIVNATILSQPVSQLPVWQYGMFGNDIGSCLMRVIDINNDGSNELILSARQSRDSWDGSDYFYILEYSDSTSTYRFKWISRIFNSTIRTVVCKDLNNDHQLEIVVGLENGAIHIFDGRTFREIKAFSSGRVFVNSMVICDVDNDEQDEIVVCDFDTTTIYSLSLAVELQIPFGGYRIQVGNVDDDEAKEIVLSSGNVIEVQQNHFVPEAEFPAANNYKLFELYDFDNDDRLELLYQTDYDQFTGYDFGSGESGWVIDADYEFVSLFIYDNPDNGAVELYLGTYYNGIACYDASGGSFKWKMPDHFYGVNNAALGDADNDGEVEIIWADGGACTCQDLLYINNLGDLTEEWTSYHLDGPFTAIDFGDVDNDHINEFVIASAASHSGYDGGVINVFNSENFELEWQSESFDYAITSVKIADPDNDSINELLVGIEFSGYVIPATFLYILNTNDYQVDTALEIMGSRQPLDIEVADINADSKNEIILGTGSGWSDDDSYIYILSGETKEILWQSPQFGGTLNYTYSLNIANIDSDEAMEIVGIDYDYWADHNGEIFIIDGQDYSMRREAQFEYSCLTLGDYDHNDKPEIIAGTNYGELVVIDPKNLEPVYYLNTDSVKITAIKMIDNDTLSTASILYSNGIQLNLINQNVSQKLWVSDSVYSSLGDFNRMLCMDMYNNDTLEVLIGGSHSVYLYELLNAGEATGDYPWTALPSDWEISPGLVSYIYPNPVTDNSALYLFCEMQARTRIDILDLNGDVVYSKTIDAIYGENRISFATDGLSAGIYICRVVQNNCTLPVNKFIKL
jgi:hypothetical protein